VKKRIGMRLGYIKASVALSCLAALPAQAASWVPIDGQVRTVDGTPVCAMVLANGQYMFSCGGMGAYSLEVPLDDEGEVTLFVFADGFAPYRVTAPPSGLPAVVQAETRDPGSPSIAMTRDMGCAYNGWVRIRGGIESVAEEPLCAMVLANGQHMFSCGASHGHYDLTVPADQNGNITLFGFADGFQPYRETFVAPSCDASLPGGGDPGAAPAVSINSTSQDSVGPTTALVPEQPMVVSGSYGVLAINDLGMHCGDLDTRVASILPPFQVLLAQVIRKGGVPDLNPSGIDLYYSAASNPSDPVLSRDLWEGLKGDGSTYKTNFWLEAVEKGAYDPFYPGGSGITPLSTGLFPTDPDVGLPVPNVEDLYIGPDGRVKSGDERLSAVQNAMPGIAYPYAVNSPQPVMDSYGDKPFFVDFPFGYVANDVDWYEGAGIPFAAFDDFGRENPYPLVRLQAMSGGTVLSTVDTVLPISGEASCTNCHTANADYISVHGAPNRTDIPTEWLRDAGLPVADSLDDPDADMPPKVSLEYAADVNVLRLHDLKHGRSYVSPGGEAAVCTINATNPNGNSSCLINKALVQNKPVVCQVCHYTPALDLAQVGPKAGAPGSEANGRNQVAHQSSSRVMHNHHGSVTAGDRDGVAMFPGIPAPIQDAAGTVTNQGARLAALERNCYQCHPGKSTKCLRGAMSNGDMLCSDCHGSMKQVGNDFSRDVQPTPSADGTKGPGKFILARDFYDPGSDTPRVPWANEPGCGSCHTGDARGNLSNSAGVIKNLKDVYGNTDDIRLIQAYRTGDAKATPIVPANKRFAEPVVPASFNGFANPGAGNPRLYRVSTGHGGVMCEGCHGATHAEWPNADPNANDNVTANQIQGHTGVISECSSCHGAGWEPSGNDALGGPHGMHVVGSTGFANGGHEHVAEQSGDACFACHGGTSRRNSPGTVLSRAAVDRTLRNEEGTVTVVKGQPLGCVLCHSGSGDDD
jgi:hypothetical protein